MRDDIANTLSDKLTKLEQTLGVASWRELAQQPGGDKAAALAYATAQYALARDPENASYRQQSQQAWEFISANWSYWVNELAQ